ncbi:two-component sensor histidine kinase [Actinospica sp. MGRD01-02]|uniref:Signal transduction histidine-protein kinase/phosphatase MprB n=2 Tax=Actinospica acidithermotolerans TaxID=2828514 RepID=A0A941IHX0_9ACTN|nr:two-component sensor histidine kinase [Actinospica acidithermotolerans]
MRSMVSAVFVVTILLGVPFAFLDAKFVTRSAQDALDQEVQRIGILTDVQLANHQFDTRTLTADLSSGRAAQITFPAGSAHASAHLGPEITDQPRASEVYQGKSGERVVVSESWAPIAGRIRLQMLLLVAAALAAFAAAAGVAYLQARRISRPFGELASTAERLGAGDQRPRHRRYGIAELDRIAEVIDHSSDRVSRIMAKERRLAADASHQLRTPLTALSMRLEEIIEAGDMETVKEEAAIALTQVERLTDVVQRLLTDSGEARADSAGAPTDIDLIIRQQIFEWRPAFRSARRLIRVDGGRGLLAAATPGSFAQVLATLLENSLMHGAGPVTIRTRTAGGSVVIEVSDEGPGVPPELGARVFERAVSGRASTGLGLTVARELAEADGGRLELLQQRPPVFALFLPRFN